MGPGSLAMSTEDFTKFNPRLEVLREDGANYPNWIDIATNAFERRKLRRHLNGTAKKPKEIIQRDDGSWYYADGSLSPLSDDEVDAVEKEWDEYASKEATIREIVYSVVTPSVLIQIKGEPTAAKMWTTLKKIYENKGTDARIEVARQMRALRCPEGANPRTTLTKMQNYREQLALMSAPIDNATFLSDIRTALPSSYTLPLGTLEAISLSTKIPTDINLAINLVYQHYDSQVKDKNAGGEQSNDNAALSNERGGGGRGGGRKPKSKKTCSNCGREGHEQPNCYSKGGPKEGQAPWQKKKTAASATGSKKDVSLATIVTEEIAAGTTGTYQGTIVDSGATSHFCPIKSLYITFCDIDPVPVTSSEGRTFQAIGQGDVRIPLPMGENNPPTYVILKGALYAPGTAYTMLSMGVLDQRGCSFQIEGGLCVIRTAKPERRVVGRIPLRNGLYRIADPPTSPSIHTAALSSTKISISDFHRAANHISHDTLRSGVLSGAILGVNLDLDSKPEPCDICVKAKAIRKSFPKESSREGVTNYGDKVVTDVWGPAEVTSLGGANYSVQFLDLASHEVRTYPMKKKSDTFEIYKGKYEPWVEVQREARIKILGSDRGGEFTSDEFRAHTDRRGTIRHLTVHDSPQSNGPAERLNRTHLNDGRAMLASSGLPKFLWAEAQHHAAWLRNRTPTKALPDGRTPHEVATGKKPNLSSLIPWGTRVWVKNLDAKKLEPRVVEGHFIGYDEESKGLRIYWAGKRRVSVERDVYPTQDDALAPETVPIEGGYDDDSDIHSPPVPKANSPPNTSPSPTPLTSHPSSPAQPSPPPTIRRLPDGLPPADENYGRGHRARNAPGFYKGQAVAEVGAAGVIDGDWLKMLSRQGFEVEWEDVANNVMLPAEFALVVNHGGDPSTIYEALSHPVEGGAWRDSILAELDQIEGKGTWEAVELPPDANVIDTRYVFRRKPIETGEISKLKSRIVARGFTQRFNIDYFETTSPVVKLSTLRLILTVAARRNASARQADVKNAYLNADFHEEAYLRPPPLYEEFRPGFQRTSPNGRPIVFKLKKCLYGTKQAGRGWYQKLRSTFQSLGYSVCQSDEAVFFKFNEDGTYVIVAVAVDDFTIVTSTDEMADDLIKELNQHFELVDLGPVKWLLGFHLVRDPIRHTISMGQQAYITDIIARMGLQDSAPVLTPMEPNADYSYGNLALSSEVLSSRDQSIYRQGIGALMYASVGTRPDITFAVSTLSQFLEKPHKTHMKALHRVFKYLKGTRELRLVLGGNDEDAEPLGYSDADWAGQLHRHSITGYEFFFGSSPISWRSKKQPVVALSSTESEYIALTDAAKELIWLRKLVDELQFYPLAEGTTLYCDNQGAITLTRDSTFHARTKHIDIRFHYIRQIVEARDARIIYCPTDEMVADMFTKPLGRVKLEKFREMSKLEAVIVKDVAGEKEA